MSTTRKFDESFSLTGKAALITGAANGVGLAIAEMFVRKGSNIAAFDKDGEFASLKSYASERGVDFLGLSGDMRDKDSVFQAVDTFTSHFKKIDVLVNCAGVGLIDPAEELSEEMWDITMDANLKGPFLLSQRVGRQMIASGGGRIINIASQAGVVALERRVAYSASKAGLIMMTKVLALEWGKHGIRVNAISPTVVLTEMGEIAWSGDIGDRFEAPIPAGRFAYPEEVAACAVFLASDATDMVNGENLVIDGGYSIT